MDFYKRVFWVLLILTCSVVAWKLVPIYYKSIAIRNICKDNADRYYRYDKGYIMRSIDRKLKELDIPINKRQHNLTKTDKGVYIEIYFEETADFFGYYKKKFEFYHECKAAKEGIYD